MTDYNYLPNPTHTDEDEDEHGFQGEIDDEEGEVQGAEYVEEDSYALSSVRPGKQSISSVGGERFNRTNFMDEASFEFDYEDAEAEEGQGSGSEYHYEVYSNGTKGHNTNSYHNNNNNNNNYNNNNNGYNNSHYPASNKRFRSNQFGGNTAASTGSTGNYGSASSQRFQEKNPSSQQNQFKNFNNYRKDYTEERKLNNAKAPVKPKHVVMDELTFDEAEKLLDAWRKHSFVQFNNWVQVSKSTLRMDFTPHQSGLEEDAEKGQVTGFSCNLTLKFNFYRHGNVNDFIAVGFGKRKQDAKKMALERLVVDLIQTGSIRLGLRDKKFGIEETPSQSKENVYFQQVAKPKPRTDFEEKLQESNQKRARKIAKKLQESLKKTNIAESISYLREISKFKQLEWNEISFIWSYGVIHQNSVLLQQVIDVINKKPLTQQMEGSSVEGTISVTKAIAPPLPEDTINSSKDFLQKYDEDRVKQKLFLHYGITRQKSMNIHDIYDSNAIEFSEREILTSGLIPYNEEESTRELVRDPFQRDLQDILVPLSTNDQTGGNSPLRTAYEKAQKWPMRYIEGQVLANEAKENIIDEEDEDETAAAVSNHPKLKFLKDFDVNSNNYAKVSEAVFGKKSLTPSGGCIPQMKRDNAVPAILLDEMYETLLYSGEKQFSLEISEKIYSQLQIETAGFVHEHSADYYAHKKNMIMTEAIDTMYEQVQSRNAIEYLCNINGKIEKIGTAHNYDVVCMTPLETQESIDQKLLKKCKFDVRETQHMIVEGDVIIMTTFFRPTYDRPVLEGESSKLATYINMRAKTTRDNRDFIHNITEFGNVVEFAMVGTVREITKDSKIKLFLCPTFEQSKCIQVDPGRQWKITKIYSRTPHERMQEALREFCFNNRATHPAILHTLCTPPSKSSAIIRRLAQSDQYKATSTKTQLNGEQQLAVEKAATNRITLIQGPPGSGKTTTAVEVVLEWLRSSNQPILVTAESQGTINVIYGELIKANVKAVTIGPGFEDRLDHINEIISKPDALLVHSDPFARLNKSRTAQGSKQQEYIPNSMKFLILKKMLREAQVVCCTCQTVMADYLKGLHFSRVIIDEANTVSEPLSLVPIHRLCSQLVLIGDHMLSAPKSISMFAQSKGVCMSLFEKLISQGFKPHLLKQQYRIAENQIPFQSRYFYNSSLENGNTEDSKSELRGFPWPNPAIKSCMIFVKGQEQATQLVDQLQNPKEVEVIVETLMQVIKAGYIRLQDIGIVSTFDEQRKRIRTEISLQAKKHPGMFNLSVDEITRVNKHSTFVDIETIERANLMDKDLIIFSPVRSNKHKALGTLRDPRLLNSILWSGKKGIIVVGDIETLSHDLHWKEYIKWAKQNNLILQYCK